MIVSIGVLALVTLQRLSELVIARRNTARLLARGAVETGAGHYPVMVLMHAAWLIGLWALAWDQPVRVGWLMFFAVLQAGRIWVLATLGARWTTRIITLPGEPLVKKGPFRFVSHPNYLVVTAEILVLPLVFGLWEYGLVFSLLNAAMLWVRIKAEAGALRAATGSTV